MVQISLYDKIDPLGSIRGLFWQIWMDLLLNLKFFHVEKPVVNPFLLHAAFVQHFAFTTIKYLLTVRFSQFQACSGPEHGLEDVSVEFHGPNPTTALPVDAIRQEVSILRYPSSPKWDYP